MASRLPQSRKWKMRLARVMIRLPGHPEGFTFQGATVDVTPHKLWGLPPRSSEASTKIGPIKIE